MIKEELIKELQELISSCFNRQGLELVDLVFKDESGSLTLKILADKTGGGITLGECALLNRQLAELLEGKNIIDGNYILEVSSPGLDRCLKTKNDFLRLLNKEVVFFLKDSIDGKCQHQGKILKADDQCVFINSIQSGKVLEIPLLKINKARLVI